MQLGLHLKKHLVELVVNRVDVGLLGLTGDTEEDCEYCATSGAD
jgi:hypothetical protein